VFWALREELCASEKGGALAVLQRGLQGLASSRIKPKPSSLYCIRILNQRSFIPNQSLMQTLKPEPETLNPKPCPYTMNPEP